MKTETIVGLFIASAMGVFFYLSFTIGAFRLDRARFQEFRAYFDDTSGLEKKDPVKIAGVEVGWVDSIRLAPDGMAEVRFLINKKNKLAKNSRAFIRQEGLLGNKFLEIDPGDSSTGWLLAGSALGFPSLGPPTIGELLSKFGDIASSIQTVASSLQASVGSKEGENNLRKALDGFARASDRIADFSEILERSLRKNEQNIDSTLVDLKDVAQSLRADVPKITKELAHTTLPRFTENFSDVTRKAGNAFNSFEDASSQAREGFKEAEQVFEKINTGKGLIGKLINEDETYSDFKKTIRNVKDYTTKLQAIDILVDMHSESMIRDWNTKGYLELRLRPFDDYFYLLGVVTDEKGTIIRDETITKRFDAKGTQLQAPNLEVQWRDPDRKEELKRRLNDIFFSFQFGKRFDRLVFRVGVFENTFGSAVDWYVPLSTNTFHWITTLETYDWRGINRVNDTRPHFKWINRIYFMKNMYTVFGVDDFVSKRSASPFFGGGLRFNDRDLKYLLPSVPISNLRQTR